MVTYARPVPKRPTNSVRLRNGTVQPRDASDNGSSDLSAPVCHLPPTSSIPLAASTNLPSVPQPDGSIESIMSAIQALIQGYNSMSGQQPNANNPGGAGGQNGQGSRFVETGRATKKVHVTNPDDDTQFVDVQVVSQLTLTDQVTGETWTWSL